MFPEILSQSIINLLVNTFDPERMGVAIEIGVGTSNFYSVVFKHEGLKCIAVDPIAYPPFVKMAAENGIFFEQACIYDKEGELTLFSSEYSDLSSVNSDWWGVDEKNQKKVKAILLETLLKKHNVDRITFLKADTEGSEYEIIKQFVQLPAHQLPLIVEFEYGGGALKASNEGGWNKKFFPKVLDIIKTLQTLGYQQGLILDSNDIEPIFFDLAALTHPEMLFKPNYEYGNILAFKNSIVNIFEFENVLLKAQTVEFQKLVESLYAENRELSIKMLKAQYLKRVVDKIKRTFKNG